MRSARIVRLLRLVPLAMLPLGCGGTDGPHDLADESRTLSSASAIDLTPPTSSHLRFCWERIPDDIRRPLIEATIRHVLEERSELHVDVDGFESCSQDSTADVAVTDTWHRPDLPMRPLWVSVGFASVGGFDLVSVERSVTHALAELLGNVTLSEAERVELPALDLRADEIRAMQGALMPGVQGPPSAALIARAGSAPPRPLEAGEQVDVCPADRITLAGGLALEVCAGESAACLFTGPVYVPRRSERVRVIAPAVAYAERGFAGKATALRPGRHLLDAATPVGSLRLPPSLRATLCESRAPSALAIAQGTGGCRKITGAFGGAASLSGAFTAASPPRLVVVERAAPGDVEVFRPALAVPDGDAPGGPRTRFVATLDAGKCSDRPPPSATGTWTSYRQFGGAPAPWGDTRCLYEWTSAGAPPDVETLRRAVRAHDLVPFVELPGVPPLACKASACAPPETSFSDDDFPPDGNDKPGCDVCGGIAINSVAYITVNPADPTRTFGVFVPGRIDPVVLVNRGAASYVVRAPFIGTGPVRVVNQR